MLGIIIDLKYKSNTFQNFFQVVEVLLNQTRTLQKKYKIPKTSKSTRKRTIENFGNILIDIFIIINTIQKTPLLRKTFEILLCESC